MSLATVASGSSFLVKQFRHRHPVVPVGTGSTCGRSEHQQSWPGLQEMGALHCEQSVFIVESQFSLRWVISAQWSCCIGHRAMTLQRSFDSAAGSAVLTALRFFGASCREFFRDLKSFQPFLRSVCHSRIPPVLVEEDMSAAPLALPRQGIRTQPFRAGLTFSGRPSGPRWV
jgi:hypothetical protein